MRREQGFTVVELMIVIAVLVPLLVSLGGMSSVVTSTVNANDRSSEVSERARRTMQRIGQLLRPGKLSSFQTTATPADVAALRATAVGEWISPTDLQPAEGVRFRAAEGLLSINAALSTPERRITFVLESGESDNDVDDDGDGLVDEGDVVLAYGPAPVRLGVFERCHFTFDGRYVRVTLVCARSSPERVYRATMSQSFYVRNN